MDFLNSHRHRDIMSVQAFLEQSGGRIMAKRNRKTKAKSRTNKPYSNNRSVKKVENPHDKRFKELFSNKKSFLSLLRDYIKDDWVNSLDEDSLKKSEKSFILQDFSELEADIVYEASLDGKMVIFYILQELQSYVDFRMPYRYFCILLRSYVTSTITPMWTNAIIKILNFL